MGHERSAVRKGEPRDEVQDEAEHHDAHHEPDALKAEHHEGRRRGDDVLQRRAALAAEEGGETHQCDVLGDHDQGPPAISPMRWANGTRQATTARARLMKTTGA